MSEVLEKEIKVKENETKVIVDRVNSHGVHIAKNHTLGIFSGKFIPQDIWDASAERTVAEMRGDMASKLAKKAKNITLSAKNKKLDVDFREAAEKGDQKAVSSITEEIIKNNPKTNKPIQYIIFKVDVAKKMGLAFLRD
jgi:hypothetical protein